MQYGVSRSFWVKTRAKSRIPRTKKLPIHGNFDTFCRLRQKSRKLEILEIVYYNQQIVLIIILNY